MKPIIFTTEMIQAILDGRKSMTRRVMKPQPYKDGMWWQYNKHSSGTIDPHEIGNEPLCVKCPYGKAGDILYVRETWATQRPAIGPGEEIPDYTNYIYKADNPEPYWGNGKWKSPRFMPKAAARIFLKVTDVRVERLQEITPDDCEREGIEIDYDYPIIGPCEADYQLRASEPFQELWDLINSKKYPWSSNPWVWVIIFTRIDKPNN